MTQEKKPDFLGIKAESIQCITKILHRPKWCMVLK